MDTYSLKTIRNHALSISSKESFKTIDCFINCLLEIEEGKPSKDNWKIKARKFNTHLIQSRI